MKLERGIKKKETKTFHTRYMKTRYEALGKLDLKVEMIHLIITQALCLGIPPSNIEECTNPQSQIDRSLKLRLCII